MQPKATFYAQATAGTTYVRCTVPARTLPGKVCARTALPVGYHERENRLVFPEQESDMAVWQFPGSADDAILIAALQETGVRVFIDVDDNYLIEPDKAPGQVSRTWQHGLTPGPLPSYDIHRKICGYADGVICATQPLVNAYRKINPNVHLCRNLVDPDDWPQVPPTSGAPVVGYAGGATHFRDLPLIEPALRFAASQGCDVHFMGIFPLDVQLGVPYLPDLGFPYSHHEWREDTAYYRRILGKLDVGFAPLKITDWSRCKSDLKAMEYLMAGALPVLSDAPPYRGWRGRVPVCRSAANFLDETKEILNDPVGARERMEEARRYVLERRTAPTEWEEALAS